MEKENQLHILKQIIKNLIDKFHLQDPQYYKHNCFKKQMMFIQREIEDILYVHQTDIHQAKLCSEFEWFYNNCLKCNVSCIRQYCNRVIKKDTNHIDEFVKITNQLCKYCFNDKLKDLTDYINSCSKALETISEKIQKKKEWSKDLVTPLDKTNGLYTLLTDTIKDNYYVKENQIRQLHKYGLCRSEAFNNYCYVCDKDQCYICKHTYLWVMTECVDVITQESFYTVNNNSKYESKYRRCCKNCIRTLLKNYTEWKKDMIIRKEKIKHLQ